MKLLKCIACISVFLFTNVKAEEVRQLTDESKIIAESIANVILRDNGDADNVDCDKAVFNAKDSIDTMLTVGEKNYNAGYLEKNEYIKMSNALNEINKRISKSECLQSEGKVKGFYKCMSNGYNHVASCGKKYNYGL